MRPASAARDHDWRIVAPWYRWELADDSDPERKVGAVRPALHKYATTDFVQAFLRDPQRSVVFDGSVDVAQRVVPVPDDELYDGDKQKWIASTRLAPDPAGTRKLFLAAHQRFYLVAVGLHCDRAGFPMVDPAHVAEVGFVVRRRRVHVPPRLAGEAAALTHDVRLARATADVRFGLDAAKERSRLLHPFRSPSRTRIPAPGAAALAAAREVELARRRLRTWALANDLEQSTEGWVPAGEGSLGAWVPMPDEPEEVVERVYSMRRLHPDHRDPGHAAHDGTIYYAAVPTSGDEVTDRGANRFNELDTYELRVFARPQGEGCPGTLVWSTPSEPFRVASFYDPTGSAQRPLEIRLPDFKELEASDALPSVRTTQPAGSSLQFSATGDLPGKGVVGANEQICFFSIPLITIVAFFVLNLFLPIVLFVFQLWWMLKLKFCLPPSIEVEAELEVALEVEPGGLELQAGIDVDVLPGTDPAKLTEALINAFDPPSDAELLAQGLEPVPADHRFGRHLLESATAPFTNNALFQVALRNGYGRADDPAPTYGSGLTWTTPVRREEVRHP